MHGFRRNSPQSNSKKRQERRGLPSAFVSVLDFKHNRNAGNCIRFKDMNRIISTAFFLLIALFSVHELLVYSFSSDIEIFGDGSWAFANVGRFDQFADLQVITFNGHGCDKSVTSIYEESCYPHPWGTNIPRTLIVILRLLGIGQAHHTVIGWSLGISAIALTSLFYFCCLQNWLSVAGILLALNSFTFRLAIERGNIDLIIFFLILIGCISASKGITSTKTCTKAGFYSVTLSCYTLAGAAKVYPLILFPLLIVLFYEPWRPKTHGRSSHAGRSHIRRIFVPSTLFITAIVSTYLYPDVPKMLGSSFADVSGGLSYGLQTFPNQPEITTAYLSLKIFFILLLTYCNTQIIGGESLSGLNVLHAQLMEDLNSSRTWRAVRALSFIAGAFLFVGTYLVFINGIYRYFIPMTLCLPIILESIKNCVDLRRQGIKDIQINHFKTLADLLFILVLMCSIGYAGYRPYTTDSNLQHLTSMYISWVILPYIISFLLASLIILVRRIRI